MEPQALRPKSPVATPDAEDGNDGQSPGPARKRAARRSSPDENIGRDSTQKRRRRAFSCLSCQRLKCRCEYDPGAQGCHRCQTLRIACSLRGQNDALQNPNPAAEMPRLGVEERLQRHEDALQEIKSMIQALGSARQTSNHSSRAHADPDGPDEGAPPASHETPDPEYLLNPVDRGSKSAPIVVLREISQHVTLGYRRMVGHGNPDLVQLGLIDEQTASDLIELFIKHQGHTLLVRGFDELRHYGDARRLSAFLHSVCCLIGVVYRDDICGTPLHRQMYEHVRITLGQAVLCSPLDLDDLNAMFIMSNNANAPSSQGVEYIDSWLLTGYCAKQAMLSIYFTQIVNRLKKGNSTAEDHRAMHLWSIICLHHLQWAATTGRPSVIPRGSHINQCNVLLSFYQATMQDSMLVAEIMLYSVLHQKLLHESYPSDGSECEEFRTWKQRWNHLLALPTSSMLRIGYHAASLILAVRALGKTGDALGSTSFLSTENTPMMGSASVGSSRQDDKTPSTHDSDPEPIRDLPSRAKDTKTEDAARDVLRANVCKYARLVLETFLEMPQFLMDTAPTCTCLCLGYCALVLAHYDASQSRIPDAVVLRLITRLDQWVQTSPGKAWSYKYGALAIRKVEARVHAPSSPAFAISHAPAALDQQRAPHGQIDPTASHDGSHSLSDGAVHVAYPADDLMQGQTVDPNDSLPSFDLSEHAMFPSMEGFFGGGFLDFMR
ncbi:putative C6 zinc finger domain-containing protein [Rosellinia necatrix]|uniref:Putative C6 zinc finger domain-containing protein n=1 Tax=Rosellinia necatrix TaxID=77044 RepID=A0A1W2TUG0_ROSNE|nr:putative C6 zinc finger domain-containing protein [Rosellinia necatrix]